MYTKEMTYKNITLTVDIPLYNEMQKFPEVNWSAVAREGIKKYIKSREKLATRS